MPPLRTIPPAKPVKTERTHAENQERAYIAASRRSDRSLEARLESARRASEIHKKRTGRSLRVTEADVINEEMYEEEDDDLPAHIRRMTAHLHTGNDPFNRRVQAYLANHIAMRSALGQAVADNWQQQQMQNNTINQYLNSALMQQQQQQNNPYAFQSHMLPPQMGSPQSMRTSPYPMVPGTPGAQARQLGQHMRSASIAAPQDLTARSPIAQAQHPMSSHSSPVDAKNFDRRFSLPIQAPVPRHASSSVHNSPELSRTASSTSVTGMSQGTAQRQDSATQPGPLHLNLSQPMFTAPFGNMGGASFGPLTSTLPLETQQLLAGAPMADLNDPAMAAMMQTHLVPTPGGSFTPAPGFYSYNPNGSKPKDKSFATSAPGQNAHLGLNATLAPGMLDASAPTTFAAPAHDDEMLFSPFAATGFGSGFDGLQPDYLQTEPQTGSGQVTPQDEDWNSWIETQALNEEPLVA